MLVLTYHARIVAFLHPRACPWMCEPFESDPQNLFQCNVSPEWNVTDLCKRINTGSCSAEYDPYGRFQKWIPSTFFDHEDFSSIPGGHLYPYLEQGGTEENGDTIFYLSAEAPMPPCDCAICCEGLGATMAYNPHIPCLDTVKERNLIARFALCGIAYFATASFFYEPELETWENTGPCLAEPSEDYFGPPDVPVDELESGYCSQKYCDEDETTNAFGTRCIELESCVCQITANYDAFVEEVGEDMVLNFERDVVNGSYHRYNGGIALLVIILILDPCLFIYLPYKKIVFRKLGPADNGKCHEHLYFFGHVAGWILLIAGASMDVNFHLQIMTFPGCANLRYHEMADIIYITAICLRSVIYLWTICLLRRPDYVEPDPPPVPPPQPQPANVVNGAPQPPAADVGGVMMRPLVIHRQASTHDSTIRGMTRTQDQEIEQARQRALSGATDGLIPCRACQGSGKFVFQRDINIDSIAVSIPEKKAMTLPPLHDMLPNFAPPGDISEGPKDVTLNVLPDAPPSYDEAMQESAPVMKRPGPLNRDVSRTIDCNVCAGKGVVDVWSHHLDAPPDEDLFPCCVCYGPSHYGISEDCVHFFCKECIVGSLESMLDAGEFPAHCPMCKGEASMENKEPTTGKIGMRAMNFLVERNVITSDFYYRFLKLVLRGEEKEITFFECPKKCGKYLKLRPLEFAASKYVKKGQGFQRVQNQIYGVCECGCQVCMRCKKEANGGKDVFVQATAETKLAPEMMLQAFSDITKKWEPAVVVLVDGQGVFVEYLDQRKLMMNAEHKSKVPGSTEEDVHRTRDKLKVLQPTGNTHEQTCTALKKVETKMDEKTKALFAGGDFKACPNCGMMIQKNGGCHFVMCGSYAHGKLSEALRNGGCGFMFDWNTMKPATTFFDNDIKVDG